MDNLIVKDEGKLQGKYIRIVRKTQNKLIMPYYV